MSWNFSQITSPLLISAAEKLNQSDNIQKWIKFRTSGCRNQNIQQTKFSKNWRILSEIIHPWTAKAYHEKLAPLGTWHNSTQKFFLHDASFIYAPTYSQQENKRFTRNYPRFFHESEPKKGRHDGNNNRHHGSGPHKRTSHLLTKYREQGTLTVGTR